jgi:protein SCO1
MTRSRIFCVRAWIGPLMGVLALAATLLSACAGQNGATGTAALNGAVLEPAGSLPSGLRFSRTDGASFTTEATRGRVSLFFFGYTHCGDVCPLTLAELSQVRRSLGPKAASVDMYFATLDPARDTPEHLRAYMANFPGVVALTGSAADLARLQTVFGVVSDQKAMPDGDYTVDHTAAIYLVNAQSKIQLAYPEGTPAEDIAGDLQHLA